MYEKTSDIYLQYIVCYIVYFVYSKKEEIFEMREEKNKAITI